MKNRKILSLIVTALFLLTAVLVWSGEYKTLNKSTAKAKSNNTQINNDTKVQKEYKVKNLPSQAKKLKHKDRDYYYNNGIYYKRIRNGYQIVKPPHGMKIKELPPRVRYIRHNNVDYYYYYHTYYRWEPKLGFYVVIDEPDWADRQYTEDRLNLTDGSVLMGQFMGGNTEEVEFLYDKEVRRIPRDEIISLEFATFPLEVWGY